MSILLPARWLGATRRALPLLIAALLLAPLASHADEFGSYAATDYDGTIQPSPEDNHDPGPGGPAPTGIPLGSDLASAFVALVGIWYGRRALRASAARPGEPG